MHGNCASCGFPVLIADYENPVTCPFCGTLNQPSSYFPTILIILALVGAIILKEVRK